MMAGQFSHSGNHGGVRGRAVGAWCKATGFGASVSTVWGGNLDLVSRQVAQAGRMALAGWRPFFCAGKC